MKPIYCPACGAKMFFDAVDCGTAIMTHCRCPGIECRLAGPIEQAMTERGAAIKAGRAMRALVRAVEVRIAKARIDGLWAGRRVGGNAAVRACYLLLCDGKLTRRQIKERMRQETNQ
jgi:hypothetical protein